VRGTAGDFDFAYLLEELTPYAVPPNGHPVGAITRRHSVAPATTAARRRPTARPAS
jgi:hypothetical protein